MRILAIYRHYWPDSPPYASMLRIITAHLAAEGHNVTMLTEQPSYKAADRMASSAPHETQDGVSVRRLSRVPISNLALIAKHPQRFFQLA